MKYIINIILGYYQSINYNKVLKVYKENISLSEPLFDDIIFLMLKKRNTTWILANYRTYSRTDKYIYTFYNKVPDSNVFVKTIDSRKQLPSNYWYTKDIKKSVIL